jgi:pyruvate carboxylase
LKGLPGIIGRPGESIPAFNFKKAEEDLTEKFGKIRDVDVMSYAMYPKVAEEFFAFRNTYGPVDKLK